MIDADAPLLTSPDKAELYRTALEMLNRSGVPYMVGGTYAFQYYAGISRSTKDIDIFVRPRDVSRVLDVLVRAGFKTEIAFSHWLAKAHHADRFIDIVFSSGNGVAEVDDEWFAHAVDEEVLGIPVKLCPPEEMIWSKAYIMERERYDGADVAHLILARGDRFDWARLLERFGTHWRVLLSHLVLFGFVYPADRNRVPTWVMQELFRWLQQELATPPPTERICQGTLLSWCQYLPKLEEEGYEDGRHWPHGTLTAEETAHVTKTLQNEKKEE
jgi:hypothetical protein